MKQEKRNFIIRLILYIFFGFAVPGAFLVWRFQLFKKVSKLSIGGWGIIFILFAIIFFWKLISSLRKGMNFGFAKQCLNGICGTLFPIMMLIVVCSLLDSWMEELIEFLSVTLICQIIAIPINPIPKWRYENNIEDTAIGFGKFIEIIKKPKTK